MTNLKAAKQTARQIAVEAAEMIAAKTVKSGPFGLLEENLDWNGKMTIMTTLMWDVCSNFQEDFKWFAEEATSYEQTENAEGAAKAAAAGIDMVRYIIDDCVDEFYANTANLSISNEIIGKIVDQTETLDERFAVYGEFAVEIAKVAQEFLSASDYHAEADKVDEYISFIRKSAQVGMILAERDLEENSESYSCEEVASTPAAVNELDAIFAAIN